MASESHDTLRETGGVQIAGLAEVVLNVHNLERSLAFYHDLLGLQVISTPERTNPIFLQVGDAGAGLPALVVLVQLPPDTPDFSLPRTLHHLALAVPADAFDTARDALTTGGLNVRFGQHPVIPSRTMYIDDPDGNEVELIAPA